MNKILLVILTAFFVFLSNDPCLALNETIREENDTNILITKNPAVDIGNTQELLPMSKKEITLSEEKILNDDNNQQKEIVHVLDLKSTVTKEETVTAPEKQPSMAEKWTTGDYMTGNWNGLRTQLEDHGLKITPRIIYSPFGKTKGGMVDTRKGAGYTLFSIDATLDTEKMDLWKGGTAYVLYQNKKGMGLTKNYMGDYQILDGWDYNEMSQLSEAWYKQQWKEGKYSLKVGQQDANTDFCFLEKGYDFLNLSFSVIPTALIPTYPDPAFGITGTAGVTDNITLKNGFFIKTRSPFNVSEVEFKSKIKNLPGRYIAGCWLTNKAVRASTNNFDQNNDPINKTYQNNYGFYTAFEQMVYKEKKKDELDSQGLTYFGQLGWSPSDRNDVDKYLGTGLHYKGIIPKRDKDILGVGVAMANFSRRLGSIDGRQGQETALECFYRIKLTPWFYLQPDVQFIFRPNGIEKNSTAFGLRTVVNF